MAQVAPLAILLAMGDRLRGTVALLAGMLAPLLGALGTWLAVQVGVPQTGALVAGLATIALVGAGAGIVARGKRGWGLLAVGVVAGSAFVAPSLFVLTTPPTEVVLGAVLLLVGLASFGYLVTAWALAPER